MAKATLTPSDLIVLRTAATELTNSANRIATLLERGDFREVPRGAAYTTQVVNGAIRALADVNAQLMVRLALERRQEVEG